MNYKKLKSENYSVYSLEENFLQWIECKKRGDLFEADAILAYLVDHSIRYKRLFMLKKIEDNLSKRNLKLKSMLRDAHSAFSGADLQKISSQSSSQLNFCDPKIIYRSILSPDYFKIWISLIREKLNLEEIKILYTGILLHGARSEVITKVLENAYEPKKSSNNKEEKIHFLKKSMMAEVDQDLTEVFYEPKYLGESTQLYSRNKNHKININDLDEPLLIKNWGDVLQVLFIQEDYETLLELEFNHDLMDKIQGEHYLNYKYYQISSLIKLSKYKMAKHVIKGEIFMMVLTKNELSPFVYLLAEIFFIEKNYSEAMALYMALQNEEHWVFPVGYRIETIKNKSGNVG